MANKGKKIMYAIGGGILMVAFLQTIYRLIYEALPKNLNQYASAEYNATMGFFEPNSLTMVVIVIFAIGIFSILIFDSD